MPTFVPFGATDPCSRLAPVLDPDERRDFALAMLRDVCEALERGGRDPTVVATAPIDVDWPVDVDERSLDDAVNGRLATYLGANPDDATSNEPTADATNADPTADAPSANSTERSVAVVMADLPLLTPDAVERLFAADADVVLAPGRGGGTNAFFARHPDFRVDYHGTSIRDHRQIAREAGATVAEVDSFRFGTDVDEPVDLVEVLLHGEGRAAAWLRDAGFAIATRDGRARVERRA